MGLLRSSRVPRSIFKLASLSTQPASLSAQTGSPLCSDWPPFIFGGPLETMLCHYGGGTDFLLKVYSPYVSRAGGLDGR
jgi:hypothetical protein